MLITNIAREIKKTFSRFIAIALIAALGVGFFGGIRTTEESMLNTADKYYKNQKVYDFKLQSKLGIKQEDVDSAGKLKDIGKAEGIYETDALVRYGDSSEDSEKEYIFHIMSMANDINVPKLKYGRMPREDGECLADYKNYSKKDIGQKIIISENNDEIIDSMFSEKEFKIVGIVTSPVYLDFERGSTNLGLGEVDSFMYTLPDAFDSPVYTTLYMRMKGWSTAYSDEYNTKLKEVKKDIRSWKPEGSYLTDRKDNTGYITFKDNADILNGVAKIFPLFFLMVSVLVCMTTMTRMIDDHRIQIGSLRAMGYRSGAILSQYLLYSVTATLIGATAGYIAGTRIFQSIIWNAYNQMYDFTDKSVHVSNPTFGAVCIGVAVLSAIFATCFSCINELREVPAALVRPRAPKNGKRILLERIKPIWSRLGFLHKVPIRNVFRYKKRLVMMVIGIGGCTALLVAGFGIKTTIKGSIDYQYDKITKYDYSIFFQKDMTESRQNEFEENAVKNDKSFNDVQIKYVYKGKGTINLKNKKHDVNVTITDDNKIRKFIDMHDKNGKLDFPKEGEIAICRKLGDKYDIKPGDSLNIKTNGAEMKVRVSAIFENYVGEPVIINTSTYEKSSENKLDLNSALVKKPDDMSQKRMRKQVTEISKTYLASGAVINIDLVKRFDEMIGSLDAVVFLVIICAGLLAFVVLYNLTNINLIERIREIATIKVLGFRNREVSAYMYRENFILTIVGIIFGLPIGNLLLRFIISKIDVSSIYFVAKLSVQDYIFSTLLTIAFTIIVSFVMYKKLINVDMVESLKSAE